MIPQHGTLEISESRVRNNIEILRQRLPRHARLGALIKADAYGHSAAHLEPLLRGAGIVWFFAYNLDEARRAAQRDPGASVLALAPLVCAPGIDDAAARDGLLQAIRSAVRLTITDCASAQWLAHAAAQAGIGGPVAVHVQIDTGLTRSGVAVADAAALIGRILELKGLRLEGLYTHLSHGDAPMHPSIAEQVRTLHQIADPIKCNHPHILIHAQNSGGTWNFSDAKLDMVRIGIALYGLQPSMDDPIPGLQPIARLVAPILMIHDRPAGVGVGYGHTFTTARPSRLAIVPVGYADGYPRALSNRGIVQIRGRNAPVVGRVSMDQIIIDVTDIPAAAPGDEVVVFSNDPAAANSIDQVARTCGTIGYEIATGLGAPRLARRVVE